MDTTETRADATRHLKDIGCKIFQVLDAGDAKILFDHYRGLGARLDELLVPAVCAKAHVFVQLLLDAGVMVTNEAMEQWVKTGRLTILNHLLDGGAFRPSRSFLM
ncbi:hypothetical protein [Stenotrophomonas maltophilia]|uniref:hypothetical protein n=1 Tax=Stenotrophomonas maltophilia TaxID=40324 RepID=UPI0021BFABB6|nr:hypothetical protein [Stenotrophomonas maltophilia]UXL28807.1 hypothetical protein N0O74_20635 [Stenotrophomonas maltophilia]